jgi:hypothetical protein
MKVKPGSPAAKCQTQWALEEDVLTHAGGVFLGRKAGDLGAVLRASLNKPILLTVQSIVSGSLREVWVTPAVGWGGDGCLGMECSFLEEPEREQDFSADFYPAVPGQLVINVKRGSPAAAVETMWSLEDDVITHAGGFFLGKQAGDLGSVLRASLDRPLQLTIQSTKTRMVRTVVIVPSLGWGGE